MFMIECLIRNGDLQHADSEFTTLVQLNLDDRDSLSQWFDDPPAHPDEARRAMMDCPGDGAALTW